MQKYGLFLDWQAKKQQIFLKTIYYANLQQHKNKRKGFFAGILGSIKRQSSG
jgi:hypothetical protein